MKSIDKIWDIISASSYKMKKSQNDIADFLGKTQGAISQMKSGAIKFTPEYLEKIIEFLNIDEDESSELRSLLWEHMTGKKPTGPVVFADTGSGPVLAMAQADSSQQNNANVNANIHIDPDDIKVLYDRIKDPQLRLKAIEEILKISLTENDQSKKKDKIFQIIIEKSREDIG
jgi:transcriptional regulator with XRE-family HTH domain